MVERSEEVDPFGNPCGSGQRRQLRPVRPGADQNKPRVRQAGEGTDDEFLPLARDQRADRGEQRRARWQIEAEVLGEPPPALDPVQRAKQVSIEPV